MATTLDVAVYHPFIDEDNPRERDPHHWAIHVLSPRRRGTIHQVEDDVGGRGYFVAPVILGKRSSKATKYRGAISLGRIRWVHVRRVRRIIQRCVVNNSSRTWNCQRWCLDVFVVLRRAGLLRVRWRGVRRLLELREHWQ